jgi:hypothetical protein
MKFWLIDCVMATSHQHHIQMSCLALFVCLQASVGWAACPPHIGHLCEWWAELPTLQDVPQRGKAAQRPAHLRLSWLASGKTRPLAAAIWATVCAEVRFFGFGRHKMHRKNAGSPLRATARRMSPQPSCPPHSPFARSGPLWPAGFVRSRRIVRKKWRRRQFGRWTGRHSGV